MNKIFRVIWNHATQSWVAVSEVSRAKGKTKSSSLAKASLAVATVIGAGSALAATTEGTLFAKADSNKKNIEILPSGASMTHYSTPNAYGDKSETGGRYTIRVGENDSNSGANNNIRDSQILIGYQIDNQSTGNGGDVVVGNKVYLGGGGSDSFSTAVGYGTVVAGPSIALGAGAEADNMSSRAWLEPYHGGVAVGAYSYIGGNKNGGVALGSATAAGGYLTTSIGTLSGTMDRTWLSTNKSAAPIIFGESGNFGATSVGYGSSARSQKSEAIGYDAMTGMEYGGVNSQFATAIGHRAAAYRTSSIAIGDNAIAGGYTGAQMGILQGQKTIAEKAVADTTADVAAAKAKFDADPNAYNKFIYGRANALNERAKKTLEHINRDLAETLAAGASSGESTIALGNRAKAKNNSAMAMGNRSYASGENSIAAGTNSKAVKDLAVSIGPNSQATAKSSLALGDHANATEFNAYAIGSYSHAHADDTIAIGTAAFATAKDAVSIGHFSQSKAEKAVALGHNNVITGEKTVVLGSDVTVGTKESVVLGANSAASAAKKAPDAVINYADGKKMTYESSRFAGNNFAHDGLYVSVGSGGKERQIKNVGAGKISSDSTDAINGSQLYVAMDELGKGWQLNKNGAEWDHIRPGDQVNFVDGLNTKLNMTGKGPASITFDVASQNVSANPNGSLKVDGDEAGFVKAESVRDAINNSGWNVAIGTTGTGTKGTDTGSKLVNPGNTVTFTAGDGIEISQNDKNITIKTKTPPQKPYKFTAAAGDGNESDVGNGKTLSILGDADGDGATGLVETALEANNENPNIVVSLKTVKQIPTAKGTAGNKNNRSKPTGALDKATTDDLVVTGKTLVDAVNNSGFRLQAVKGTGTVNSADDGEPTDPALIQSGNLMQLEAGDNIDLAQDGKKITINAKFETTDIPVDNTTGAVGDVTNGDKLVNGTTVAEAIKKSGWNLNIARDDVDFADLAGNNKSKVSPGDEAIFKAGKNLKIKKEGNNVTYATKDTVDFTHVNSTNGITLGDSTKPLNLTSTGTADKPVLTVGDAGKPATITNLNGTLPVTKNTSEPTLKQDAPQLSDAQLTNAATVGDVLNAGWNLRGAKTAGGDAEDVDFVKPYDTVEFVSGDKETTDVVVTTDNNKSTVTIKAKVKPIETTDLTVDEAADSANLGKVVKPAEADKTKLVTAENLTNAINNSGWVATAGGNLDGNATKELVKAGEVVTFKAGKNLVVKQEGQNFTYSTAENVSFTHVNSTNGITLGNDTKPVNLTANDDGNLQVGNATGAPVKITNVAPAELSSDSKDAVNGSQLYTLGDTTANVLGGGAKFNTTTGAIDKPTFNVAMPNGSNVEGHNTVGDAINALNASVNLPLTFAGNQNNGANTTQKLGSTLNIKGGLAEGGSNKNVGTNVTSAGNLEIVFSENPEFKSVNLTNEAGTVNLTPTADGLNVSKANGDPAKIGNVANGTDPNDAVNLSQLNASKTFVDATGPVTVTPHVDTNNGTTYTVSVKTTTLTPNTTAGSAGRVDVPKDQGASLMNASKVAEAINKSGFNLVAKENGGLLGNSTASAEGKQINPGENFTLDAGTNIKITQVENGYEVATKTDLNVTSISVGGSRGNATTDGTLGAPSVILEDNAGNGEVKVHGEKGEMVGIFGDNATIVLGKGEIKDDMPETAAALTINKGPSGVEPKDGEKEKTRFEYITETGATEVIATLNDGLKFKGDNETVINKTLNSQLDIVGGADNATLTENNIGVNAKDGKLFVQLSKDINLTPNGSLTVGPVTINKDGIDAGNKPITNVTSTLPDTFNGIPSDENPNPATKSQDVPNLEQADYKHAATVGDVLNAGWNLQNNGDAKDFVKPYDTVNFVDGGNTKSVVTTSEDGKTSNVSVNVVGLPVQYTAEDGTPVAKVGDKFYKVDENGNPTTTEVAPANLVANMINPAAKPNEMGAPTTLGNVEQGAKVINSGDNTAKNSNGDALVKANDGNWYKAGDVTDGKANPNVEKQVVDGTKSGTGGLLDLANSTNTNAVTVADLKDMGWVVGAPQTEGGYTDQVRNANKVDFIGEGLAKVTGKTNATTGVREITVSVNVGDVITSEVSKDGNKLVNVGDKYYNPADIDTETGKPKADAAPVAIKQGDKFYAPDQFKADGTLKENPQEVAGVTENKNAGAGLVTGNQVADAIQRSGFVVGKQNKLLAADDFKNEDERVNPDDNLRFANGKNTDVKLATKAAVDASGKVVTETTVKVDVDLPIDFKYTDATGKEYVKANDGKFYEKDAVNPDGTLVPAAEGQPAPTALSNEDVSKLNKGAQLTNGMNENGKPNAAYDVQDAVEKAAEKAVKDTLAANPNATPAELAEAVSKAKGEAIKANPEAKDTITAGTGGVTLDNVAWATKPDQAVNKDQLDQTVNKSGFFVKQNGTSTLDANKGATEDAKTEKVTPNDVVNFVNGGNTVAKAVTKRDEQTGQDVTNVTYNVVGLPVQYTAADGTPVAKVGDKFYKVGEDGNPTEMEVAPANLVANMINPAAKPNEMGAPTKLGNVADGDISSGSHNAVNGNQLFNYVNVNGVAATKPDGKVNFVNGDGTTVSTNEAGNITYNVNTTTFGTEPNGVEADGKVAAPTDPNAFVKAGDIAKAINNSGFNLDVKAEAGSTGKVVANDNAPKRITAGNHVNVVAGNNIEIKRSGSDVTVATSANPIFESVQLGKADANGVVTGPKLSTTDGTDIKVSQADGKTPARITNVAPGHKDTDAVNVSQLKGVANNLSNRINRNNKNNRAGIAGANAAAGLPQVYIPGKSMVAAAAGSFKGQSAVAVGYSRASDNGKLILKLQGNANTQGDIGGSIGVGYQW
ncbi:trimeric autotransporter adhesin [Vespertiliibacter pulmonis]|uniref:Trimeric autotransporter adhesin n=1 Tax=Vespertiliibacter pulmonis TaxID=1443036 RepID=A0A3N4VQH3_9PAST|nr:YadA-like family protein [Vespertiliibacter pulmonis]RPE83813.1 trimeric autotransporter adhesin [Vespertiliibacter pulmonis]